MNTEPENIIGGAADRPEDYGLSADPNHIEISGAMATVDWAEKSPGQFITYPKRAQGSTSACVAYWLAKQLSVDELSENGVYRELSPRSVYHQGFVPGGGMNSLQAANLAAERGLTLEHLLPSDGLNETAMESGSDYASDAKQVAIVYKPDQVIQCPADFDTLASVISQYRATGRKKVIGITLMGENNGSWFTQFPVPPKAPPKSPGLWYHRVSVTDFGRIAGKRYISIDNTFGPEGQQQFLGEEWLPYIFAGIYTLNRPDNWQDLSPRYKPPSHRWHSPLSVGSTGPDVAALQAALQSMGMFPVSDIIKPTGYYGGLTKAGVTMFQLAFGLPSTGAVDQGTEEKPGTMEKLNELFG